MRLFVREHLRDAWTILGPAGSGAQKLFALVRRTGDARDAAPVAPGGIVDLSASFPVDIDGDQVLQPYAFTREPQVLDVTHAKSKRRVRLINVHLKSKYVHNGASAWRDPERRPEFVRLALLARRRISAEAFRLRAYLDALLAEDIAYPVVLCGDMNDGPGARYFERHYLTHNLVAALAGGPFDPPRMFRHGFIDRVRREDNYTAVFDDFVEDVRARPVLLDHILVSPGLAWDLTQGLVEHEVFEAHIDRAADPDSRQALPSDHRPQSITF